MSVPIAAWRLAFALAVLAVGWLTLTPSTGGEPWFWQADKLQHAAAFAVLAWLGARSRLRPASAVVWGLLAFGAATEIGQAFIPSREASLADFGADSAGLFLVWAWQRRCRASHGLPEEDRGQVARE